MANSASQTVDKTENVKNNGTKILVLPGESLKSQKLQPQTIVVINIWDFCKFKQNLTIWTGGEMLEFPQEK